MPPNSSDQEQPVIILAPIGQDAEAMASLLADNGIPARISGGLGECCQQMPNAVGVLLLTEEALHLPDLQTLLDWLKTQPPWSELPVIVLTRAGELRWARLLDLITSAAGSLTVLERPISSATLLHSVQVALRSRQRQFQVRDLLELKQKQQRALQESEERFRTVIEQVTDYAIFRIDQEGHPTSWNEGVRRILGFGQEEFLGARLGPIIFTPEDLQAGVPERELREAVEKGSASNDRWLLRRDGTRFYATGVTTALRDEAGQLTGFSKVLRDETFARKAQDALAEAHSNLESAVADRTRDLQATNEQLEAFAYSIAHDLRSPLRSMIGCSQLLTEDHAAELSESARSLLARVQASAEFMDKLLLDLLAFGRTARAEMSLAPVDVEKAWEMAIFQCSSQVEQTQARIETAAPFPRVMAHEVTLGQTLANLLGNALKFVGPGVTPRVRFRAEDRENHVRFWIEDNGLGISPEHHDRVFRVFERLHGARYQGTGIGLSIVRKGIERMGGKVGLKSEPGKGSSFWIELAKARQDE